MSAASARTAPRWGSARWWRSHNLRMRLTLWYVGAMVVVLAVYATAIYLFVSQSVSQSLDERLRADFYWAAVTVDETEEGVTLPQVDLLIEDEEPPWVQVWSAGGERLLFANAEAMRRPVPESQMLAAQAEDRIVSVPGSPVPIRILSRHSYIGTRPVAILVARSEAVMRRQLRDLMVILVFGLPIAVAAAGLGGYTLARGALAPIERMTERARTITAERLHDRLPVDNPDDEMGRLASVFNETLARLETSFVQMQRFTADVSHELRTPLTAIRSVGEVGLRGHRDETAYRSIIGSMLEEADRLASLVDRLLTLSRAEARERKVAREPVELRALAEDAVAHLGVLAEEKRQSLVVEANGTSTGLADRGLLRQAIINLVDNAIKFTPPGGTIRIRVGEGRDDARLEVVDSGPGVSDEARARIFDRFYRADGVETHGTGLGLSIAKGAVEANGGRLTLERTGPEGSTFRIAVPRVER